MKALVLEEFGRMKVVDRPDPAPGPTDVLIRILATGICGSDIHGFTGETGRRHPGQVMGHETVGYVTELGSHVDSGPDIGALVTVNPVVTCGHCERCRSGQASCEGKYVMGVDPRYDGAFAEYLVVPEQNVVELQTMVDPYLGALVEPSAVGWHAIVRGAVSANSRVLVIGGGPIGQAVGLAASRADAEVLVSEPNHARRGICEVAGLRVLDPSAGGVDMQVRENFGSLADIVVDAVGTSLSMADALASSCLGSRIVLVGMASQRLDISAFAISTQERCIIGAFSYASSEFAHTAAWVDTNPAPLPRLVGERIQLGDAPDVFADLASGSGLAAKILVTP